MEQKRRSGRPKKAESDKVQYQRIAVYSDDYVILNENINRRNQDKPKEDKIKLVDAFSVMVKDYTRK